MGFKHTKRYLTLLIMREIQITTTMTCHYLSDMQISKSLKTHWIDEDEKNAFICCCWKH